MDVLETISDCAAIRSRIEHHLDVVSANADHGIDPNVQLREVTCALDSAQHLFLILNRLRQHFVGCALAHTPKAGA